MRTSPPARRWIAAALLLAPLGPPAARADGPAAPQTGSLVIVGGGGMPDSVRARFLALGGGKAARVVVIPTASEDADKPGEAESYLKPWRASEPAKLTLLHTRSRDRADSAEFVAPLADATAVWFSGGDQNKLIAAYRGTATERAFRDLLARGGVIGGTSAGAAVMSEVMIRGGNPRAEVGEGFGFVRSAVFDQHFLKRNRLDRLYGVVAERPGLVGIGIDEATAFVVEGDRWSVVGRSFVVGIEPARDGKPPRFASWCEGDHGRLPASGLPAAEAGRRAAGE